MVAGGNAERLPRVTVENREGRRVDDPPQLDGNLQEENMNRPVNPWRAAAPAAALILCACALSPQVVQIRPVLEPGRETALSAPATVALAVADVRPNAVVGHRGGVYATASISTAADTPDTVRTALAAALGARGFRVMAPDETAAIRLDVELVELGYVARQEKLKLVIETSATVRARSVSGDTTRTGEYRDRRTKEALKPPGEFENAELINAVLSGALQRLVADPELLSY
jgi:uncharacterized lipoprotein